MTELLVVRHGQSTFNAQGRWTGSTDAPLTRRGEDEAVRAAASLTGAGLTAAVTSDLQRARRTAELFAEVLGLGTPLEDPRLRERRMGEWEGLTRDDIAARWPEMFAAHQDGRLDAPPGGEPMREFEARVHAALVETARRFDGARVLVVAHGGVLRAIDRLLEADPAKPLNCGGRWYTASPAGLVAGLVWRAGGEAAPS